VPPVSMYNTGKIMKEPDRLKIKSKGDDDTRRMEAILPRLALYTDCEGASRADQPEFSGINSASFMILGRICTRHCAFCDAEKGRPGYKNHDEPMNIALAVKELNLEYAVITSVTRDDLADGGASQFVKTILKIREMNGGVKIMALVPDFGGILDSLTAVVNARPDVIGHDIETVPALYDKLRPQANYLRSLKLLINIKKADRNMLSKSGFMVGFGEKENDVVDVLKDLRKVGCDFLTIGQYLSPSGNHYPAADFVHPDVFEKYKDIALDMGFKFVLSAPFAGSSHNAGLYFKHREAAAI
jgi:lipoyl synthase